MITRIATITRNEMNPLPKLLVLGWYGKGNLGDELMAESLTSLFEGKAELRFVDFVKIEDLLQCAGLIVGGGSILDSDAMIDDFAMMNLHDGSTPIFFVGVGAETGIHHSFYPLVKMSKVFAYRDSSDAVRDLSRVHDSPVRVPDLAYAFLPNPTDAVVRAGARSTKVKIIPNYEVVPKWDSAHWKHAAWSFFKSEFSQFLDELPASSDVSFSCMCVNEKATDFGPAYELAGASKKFGNSHVSHMIRHSGLLGMSRVIITQRFHGAILAEITGVPYVMIGHHDKMKTLALKNGIFVPYYGVTKRALSEAFKAAHAMDHVPSDSFAAARTAYEGVVDSIMNSLR